MTTWRKVGCFLVTAVAAFSALAAIDADSYVQRGLVAQWDGIDNLATGTHVADANVWVDRTGNSTDLTADYLSFADGMCAYLKGKTITSTCSKLPLYYADSTIEIHAFSPKYTKHSSVDNMLSSGQGSGFFWQNGEQNFGCTYFGNATEKYFAGSGNNPFSFNPSQSRNITTVTNTWSLTAGNYTRSVYANGAEGTTANWNFWQSSYTPSQMISFGSGNEGTHYKAFSIRVYDRQLSVDEIALNVAIDKVRFHGAVLADALPATLPDGYRLNAAQDGLEVRVRAVVEDESGALSVNGGDAQASNEVWVPKGAQVEVVFSGVAGRAFGRWVGAPESAVYPSNGTIRFAANDPLALTGEGKIVSENPIVNVSAPAQVAEGSFLLSYDVVTAGSAAEDVTLYVCYGQDPERLSNTNAYEHVIGEGNTLVDGLIHTRTYYVKIVADGNGHVTEGELLSVTTKTGTIYGTYEAAQPVVKTMIASGLQESFRVCGDMTAPEGTKLIVRYGTTADVETMTAAEFDWDEWHQPDGCHAIVSGVASGTYSVVVELRNGSYLDRCPTVATVTVLAATTEPVGTRRAAVFDGNSYLQTKRIPTGIFTGPFTMCIWAKNPRANLSVAVDEYGLNRAGDIMRCGGSGQGVPGPSISMSPVGWTKDTDAAFCADPKYVLSAGMRSSENNAVTVSAPVELGLWKDDKWHFIVLTWQPQPSTRRTLALYLDGKKVGESVVGSNVQFTIADPNYALTFGALQHAPTANGQLIGSLAEASVWNRVLSDKEIRRLMRYTADPKDPSLVGYWLTSEAPYTVDRSKTANPNDLDVGGSVAFDAVRDLKIRPTGLALFVR